MTHSLPVSGTPDLSTLLSDPIVKLMMKADCIEACHITAVVEAARRKFLGGVTADGEIPTLARKSSGFRAGVGIMLLNAHGFVLVGHRRGAMAKPWQMPQGGIDPGETPREAAYREMLEELGTDKAEVLAESADWLQYDLPETLWIGNWQGQRQKWFAMRFLGKDADISVDTVDPEFSEWRWVAPSRLPDLAVEFKRALYVRVLEEFSGVLADLPPDLLVTSAS